MNGKDGGAKGWVDKDNMLPTKTTIACWRGVHGQRNKIISCYNKTCTLATTMASKPWILKLQIELTQLLQLASMELEASKSNYEQAKRKKKS
jgi:hypothetical protein